MWTDRRFRVGNRHVTASIRLLAPAQRQTVATAVAWLATASVGPHDANAQVWKTLMEDVIGPHLTLTVDHDQPERLDRAWWNETIRRAASAFIRVNGLESLIERSWSTWPEGGSRSMVQ